MLSEKLPEGTEYREVRIFGPSPDPLPGRVLIKRWTRKERIRRGFRLSAKILIPIMLCALPLGVLEPFAFLLWGSAFYLFILTVAGPLLFSKYYGEEVSFFLVEGQCPACQATEPLTPFLHTQFEDRITVLCRSCGQTLSAETRSP